MGTWEHTAGEWYGDAEDKGIKTSVDARFYGLSAPLTKPFKSDGKDLVIQYSVKHEQDLDCGGAYIKLLPGGKKFDAKKFGGDSPYAVMFGPDVCGSSNKKTHVILNYEKKDDNLLVKKNIMCETDDFTHLYTLVIKPDNTFEVFVDNKSVRQGKLEEEFDFLPPAEIKDPDAKKPDDWVEEATLPDPEDVKPEGYDDIPAEIADPDAKKPDDWDDEDDGEWEPPMIDNPDYKGKWKQKTIPNPDYKGKWEAPMIANPDYKYDDDMYKVCKDECTHVGFELWQVKTGTLFDDIIVTDSLEEAQKFAEETFFKKKDAEKEMYDKIQEERRAKEKDEMVRTYFYSGALVNYANVSY
jgi:calreticulin